MSRIFNAVHEEKFINILMKDIKLSNKYTGTSI